MTNFSEIIKRMIRAAEVENEHQLAVFLGMDKGSVNKWKQRKKVPDPKILKISHLTDASYEWLLSGEGPGPDQPINKTYEAAQEYPPRAKMPITTITSEIDLRLFQTREVLESRTPYANALDANIIAFHRSIETEKRVARIEQRLGISFHEDIDGESPRAENNRSEEPSFRNGTDDTPGES